MVPAVPSQPSGEKPPGKFREERNIPFKGRKELKAERSGEVFLFLI